MDEKLKELESLKIGRKNWKMQSKKRPRHSKEFKKEVIQMVNDGVKRSKVTKEYGILPGTLSKWIQSSKCRKDDTDEAKSLSNMYNDIDNEMRSGEESERNISENVSDVDADMWIKLRSILKMMR